jgi:hypothetical protein
MVVSLAIRKNVSIAGANVVDREFSRYASNGNAAARKIYVDDVHVDGVRRRL